MLGVILKFFGGGIVGQVGDQLNRAHKAKLDAKNSTERIEADKTITRIEAARSIAVEEASDRWSATSIGRMLIVVPFGLWWAAIYLIQIINPWFGLSLVVVDVPPNIHDMAIILVPAIVIADAGALSAKRIFRRK